MAVRIELMNKETLLGSASSDFDYTEALLADKSYEDVYGVEGVQQRAVASALLGIGKLLLAQER